MSFQNASYGGNVPQARTPSDSSELDVFWNRFDRDISPLSDISSDNLPVHTSQHDKTVSASHVADMQQDITMAEPATAPISTTTIYEAIPYTQLPDRGYSIPAGDGSITRQRSMQMSMMGPIAQALQRPTIILQQSATECMSQAPHAPTSTVAALFNNVPRAPADIKYKPSLVVKLKASPLLPATFLPNSPDCQPKRKAQYTKRAKAIAPAQLPILQSPKPEPVGGPSIWAEMRQELCEAFPFFRSYQGGLYCHNGVARGVLLDSVASDRDICGDRVIVTHSGGKSTQNAETGVRSLAEDQTVDDVRIKALRNNLLCKFPIAIVVGDKYTSIETRVPHRYNVLDWFKVTHAWAEKDSFSGLIRWKFRYEKLDFQRTGWWARAEAVPNKLCILEDICRACGKQFPHVYRNSFICFNAQCPAFFKLRDHGYKDADNVDLQYTEEFLNAETPGWEHFSKPPTDLNPETFSLPVVDGKVDLDFVSRKAWKGWCCSRCGRLNSKNFWNRWQCANTACSYTFTARVTRVFTPLDLADDHRPLYTGYPIIEDEFSPEIGMHRSTREGYTVMTYDLPRGGRVTHMVANLSANAQAGGADWLLMEYQTAGIPFERYLMNVAGGTSYTAHYTHNVGAQYKYVASQPTVTFEEAHPVVRAACDLLKGRVNWMHPEVDFNEILSVGYLEDQAMNYHQDGEKGLGPTVASISLGCPAEMCFRVKKTGNGKISKPCLKLMLHHGDIMIMHGADIQRVYEHAAKPLGKFRIAATARWIDSEEHLGTAKPTTKTKVPSALKIESPAVAPNTTMTHLNTSNPVPAVKAYFRNDMDWDASMIFGDVPETVSTAHVTGWIHYDPKNPDQ
ncbi:Similar to hypothetical protein [Tuber melanosporum Mel28]; acc. no. XP_002836842 [Pyronema omphalodes CBS 100304]|uniref:Fe2OG dioxygenase domain-containing protein n=1 Tax=Pyronema omphalodes (strain CBS 100304) TaxID=1076935 RepID=U4LBA9_PYROM|nr:Similar to hypothetical protein [Tuber melanosporum Mel28]; acc. no. XP_002836842 [Pyronema omphalodes CBS 100304]